MIKLLYTLLLIFPMSVFAQGVTIGSNNPPNPSAGLELDFNNKGFLMPRLTTAQRNAISTPAIGLQIYNTDNHCVETYFPNGWKPIGCDCTTPPPSPSGITGPLTVCPGSSSVLFSAQPVQGASSYTWSISNPDVVSSGQGNDSVRVNFSNSSGTRTLSVIATNSCGSSAPFTISINGTNPSANFTVNPTTVTVNNAATFTATTANANYAWTFQSGSPATATTQAPQVTWTTAGTYAVNLTVTDANGCSSTASNNVTVINCQPFTRNFTTCGQTGRTGPSQGQCDGTYGTGIVNVSGGVQLWTVPQTGNYTITAAGAQGGDKSDYQNNGGRGETVSASIALNGGDVIAIVVGQQGGRSLEPSSSGGGGGGGGSFVYNFNTNVLYVAAGGGGGIGAGNSTRKLGRNASPGQAAGTNQQDNDNGPSTYTYNAPTGSGGGSYGGVTSNPDYDSGGGAGWNSNGMNGLQFSGTEGGRTRVNGWLGGNYSNSRTPYVAVGGFGGGGGASDGGGGGGGYTGGNGGRWNSLASGGGGGTSYVINNANPTSLGLNTGNGFVTIALTCP